MWSWVSVCKNWARHFVFLFCLTLRVSLMMTWKIETSRFIKYLKKILSFISYFLHNYPTGLRSTGQQSLFNLRLRMSGAEPLLPLYPAMAWTGKTLPFIVTNSIKQSHSWEAGSFPTGQELTEKNSRFVGVSIRAPSPPPALILSHINPTTPSQPCENHDTIIPCGQNGELV